MNPYTTHCLLLDRDTADTESKTLAREPCRVGSSSDLKQSYRALGQGRISGRRRERSREDTDGFVGKNQPSSCRQDLK